MTYHSIDPSASLLLLGGMVALVHATFQLGVSVLTMLSGHSLSRTTSSRRVLNLSLSYYVGSTVVMTLLLITTLYCVQHLSGSGRAMAWLMVAVVASVTSVAVMLTYYRHSRGTVLWIPRRFAIYLSERASKTRRGIEAGALGGVAVIAELPFTFVLFVTIALAVAELPGYLPVVASLLYVFVASLPLLVITTLLSGGHRISDIQRWREQSKGFLQFLAGFGLLALVLYIASFCMAVGAAS